MDGCTNVIPHNILWQGTKRSSTFLSAVTSSMANAKPCTAKYVKWALNILNGPSFRKDILDTLEPLYKMVHYKTAIRRFKSGSQKSVVSKQKCIDYIEK